jgi:hypothetical protein
MEGPGTLIQSREVFSNFLLSLRESKDAIGYYGRFSQPITNHLLNEIRFSLGQKEANTTLRKRVFAIAVECFDNIEKYYKENPDSMSPAFFSLTQEDSGYYLTSANMIDKAHTYDLSLRLEVLNGLKREDLSSEMRETLLLPNIRETNGAGLGLIIMAIRTGNRFEYFFEDADEKNQFFVLRIKISK